MESIRLSCADAVPTHSYVYFNGSVPDITFEAAGARIIVHGENGNKELAPYDFGNAYSYWDMKGLNQKSAIYEMERLRVFYHFPKCDCAPNGAFFSIAEEKSYCWHCGADFMEFIKARDARLGI